MLWDTPVDHTSASPQFHIYPRSPVAKQSALRLDKSILRCYWKQLQLWSCIQGAPYRIQTYWRGRVYSTCLRETSRAAETAVQLYRKLGGVFSQQWLLGFQNHMAFHLSYWSWIKSQDLKYHFMACIIYLSESIYIHMVKLPEDTNWAQSEEHLESSMERKYGCTCTPLWRENLFLTTTIQCDIGNQCGAYGETPILEANRI